MKSSGKRKMQQHHKPSPVSLWVTGAFIIGFIGFSAKLIQQAFTAQQSSDRRRTNQKVTKFDVATGGEPDDRVEYVRGALFSRDGSYAYDSKLIKDAFEKGDDAALAAVHARAQERQSRFAQADYWEERYKKSTKAFDWFGTWNSDTAVRIKPVVEPFLPSHISSILNMGCGNSRLSEELMKDGYSGIVGMDISPSVIDAMSRKFAGNSALSFVTMDMTAMTFADASFDVVFDKGTLDALYTGAPEKVRHAVAHVFRILRPGGVFVSMTFGSLSNRKDLNMTSGRQGDVSGWESFHSTSVKRDEMDYSIFLMTKPKLQ